MGSSASQNLCFGRIANVAFALNYAVAGMRLINFLCMHVQRETGPPSRGRWDAHPGSPTLGKEKSGVPLFASLRSSPGHTSIPPFPSVGGIYKCVSVCARVYMCVGVWGVVWLCPHSLTHSLLKCAGFSSKVHQLSTNPYHTKMHFNGELQT